MPTKSGRASSGGGGKRADALAKVWIPLAIEIIGVGLAIYKGQSQKGLSKERERQALAAKLLSEIKNKGYEVKKRVAGEKLTRVRALIDGKRPVAVKVRGVGEKFDADAVIELANKLGVSLPL